MSDYNVKPYLGHKSYVDMMRTIPKSSNRGGQPDSEFEKPYMNPKGDYMDMQMNHEINYAFPYPSSSVSQVDSPLVSAAVGGGGDILMDAKGIVDGVKQDFPEVAWGTPIPLFMAGRNRDGDAWAQESITWKILQPANGELSGNNYLATDEDSETNIQDNIMGIAPDGNFSNIIVETRPKFRVKFISTGAVHISPLSYTFSYQDYNFQLIGAEPPDGDIIVAMTSTSLVQRASGSYYQFDGVMCNFGGTYPSQDLQTGKGDLITTHTFGGKADITLKGAPSSGQYISPPWDYCGDVFTYNYLAITESLITAETQGYSEHGIIP